MGFPKMTAPTTERMIFSGHVQGVGFRFTVHSLARQRPVDGYVRNLPDGTVEVVVRGKLPDINALLADVQQRFRDNIHHCERTPIASSESFDGFEIRL
jgi:acylphosphatase